MAKNKNFVKYIHHGNEVWVNEDLKGKHREHCLCYSCGFFKPDKPENCIIAKTNYHLCLTFGIVTPVYECMKFLPAKTNNG